MSIRAVLVALVASTSMSQAGGYAEPIVPVVPAPAPAPAPVERVHDWSGFYGGVAAGYAGSEIDLEEDDFEWDEGTALGLFGGYQMQRGNLVFGGELAYYEINGVVNPGDRDEVNAALDLRARVGYAVGRTLFYGAVGASGIDFTDTGGIDAEFGGYNYGLGVEFLATKNVFVGLDLTRREIGGYIDESDEDWDGPVDTATIRVGLKF